MPISRLALLSLLLVLAIGLGPANASTPEIPASPIPPPLVATGLETNVPGGMFESPRPADLRPATAEGGSLEVELADQPPAIGVTPVKGDPSTAPSIEPAVEPSIEPTPAPTCPPVPADVAAVPAVRNGARTNRVVALTFDDGWDEDNTLRILRTLRNARVNATFFPLGKAIEGSPSTWRAVAAAGYPIADHTYDHATLSGRCYQAQLSELTRFQSTAKRLLGITPLAVARPPGGAYDGTTRRAAAAAGEHALVLWDIDTRDWSGPRSGTIAARALEGEPGSIVLMHTYPDATAAALPAIIAGYRARGFAFVTIGTLLGIGGSVPFE